MIWPLLVLSPLHFLCDVAGLSGSQQHCAIEVCIFEHVPNDGVLTAETVGVIVILASHDVDGLFGLYWVALV